ncbi:MAG: NAD-dependent epimerase/dehydratase family protein [Crocinitomix sp.]|nr:NAD-dependent epimerase/dehydratase family protein [Crocinitomix sp.]
MLEGKRILVTGGAGFIGSNLCEFLVEKNEVRCLDSLLTGHQENIQHLLDHPQFTFIKGDVRDYEVCLNATEGVDVIFHQAALGSVPRSIETPLNTNAHNVTGFLNMLEAAKNSNVKRFVFATSSSVYGDHEHLPKTEGKIGKPLSPYAVTKYVNEMYADVYARLYGIETIGLRYFNVFGRRQDPNGVYAAVIPRFVKLLQEGKAITVNGDGEQTRDFTYIDNVIQANVLAATVEDSAALNTIYNIGCGSTITLNELIQAIQECFKENDFSEGAFEVIYGPKRKGDIEHSYASIAKATEFLKYNPTIDLKEGMRRYLGVLIENELSN